MGQCCSHIRISNFKNDGEVFEDIAKEHLKIRQYDQALLYFNKALDYYRQNGGENQESVAGLYLKMVRMYELQEKFNQEMNYYKKALEIYQNIYGETDKKVEDVCEALASGYWMEGIHEEAEKYYEKLIEIKKALRGENSMEMASLYERLAISCEKTEKYRKAVDYFRKAYEIKKDVGAESDSFSLLWMKIGRIYLEHLKEYDKAKESYDNLLGIDKEMRGEYHYCTCQSYLGLGRSKAMLKQYNTAFQDLQRALEVAQRVEWPDPAQRSKLFHVGYVHLGLVAEILGRRYEALECHRKWIELQLSEDSGTGYAFVFHTRIYGEILHEVGLFDDAEAQFKIALEALKMIGNDSLERARIYISYAPTMAELKEFDQARKILESIKKELLEEYPKYDEVIEIDQQLALLQAMQENYQTAISAMEKVLEKYKDKYGSQHITVINCLFQIGLINKDRGDVEEALKYLKEAYSIMKNSNVKILRKQGDINGLEYEAHGVLFDISQYDHLQSSPKAFAKECYWLAIRAEMTGQTKLRPSMEHILSEIREICNKSGKNYEEITQSLN